jgi:hypothetical protein
MQSFAVFSTAARVRDAAFDDGLATVCSLLCSAEAAADIAGSGSVCPPSLPDRDASRGGWVPLRRDRSAWRCRRR